MKVCLLVHTQSIRVNFRHERVEHPLLSLKNSKPYIHQVEYEFGFPRTIVDFKSPPLRRYIAKKLHSTRLQQWIVEHVECPLYRLQVEHSLLHLSEGSFKQIEYSLLNMQYCLWIVKQADFKRMNFYKMETAGHHQDVHIRLYIGFLYRKLYIIKVY